MNAEQRGGMALNKDFRSKTGNGSASREGRAIATPTGELHPQHPSLPSSIFIYFSLALLLFPSLCTICPFLAFLAFFFFFFCCSFILIFHSLPLSLSPLSCIFPPFIYLTFFMTIRRRIAKSTTACSKTTTHST